MNKNHGLVLLAGFVVVVAFLHFIALYFHLYWSLWWFDIVMHFLGGAWVAAFTLWHMLRLVAGRGQGRMKIGGIVVLTTLCVGVLWEVYEYVFGVSLIGKEAYVVDTTLDIVMDTVGAITVSACYIFSHHKTISL